MCKGCGDPSHIMPPGRGKKPLHRNAEYKTARGDYHRPIDGGIRTEGGGCVVCELPGELLIELNLLMGDPEMWPAATFEGLNVPKGVLPPSYRLWGAIRIAKEWAKEHNRSFVDRALRVHYHRHVHQLPQNVLDVAITGGSVEYGQGQVRLPAVVSPINFRQYYAKGLELGHTALDLLLKKVQAMEAAEQPVPVELLTKLADLGAKLATNAASLEMRGFELMRNRDDEMEGFRAGSAPAPSQRMGHHRIRVIDGEARPVVDEGRADRRTFNERAAAEGNTELPA